jgi:hypothetical protein
VLSFSTGLKFRLWLRRRLLLQPCFIVDAPIPTWPPPTSSKCYPPPAALLLRPSPTIRFTRICAPTCLPLPTRLPTRFAPHPFHADVAHDDCQAGIRSGLFRARSPSLEARCHGDLAPSDDKGSSLRSGQPGRWAPAA